MAPDIMDQSYSSATAILGVDIGGTFTDFISIDPLTGEIIVSKAPTTPGDLVGGVRAGVDKLQALHPPWKGPKEVRHGTTVVINALLEGHTAKVALLCTEGHRDTLEMRRLWREHLFGYQWKRPEALVPRYLRIPVPERVNSAGESVRCLDEEAVRRIGHELKAAGVEAIAISYLFSFLHPEHEERTRDILKAIDPDWPISVSSEILPEIREYERTSTTVANAMVQHTFADYLNRVASVFGAALGSPKIRIVRSDGALVSTESAARYPIRLVQSGPAAGVIAAAQFGQRLGHNNLITLDMGGTSTDVSLVWDGRPQTVQETDLMWNIPVRATLIDIRSIGAGGGSIARVDRARALHVGPESAGSDPGPACYGLGGELPTITDALLVLGLLPDALLGQDLPLDRPASERALQRELGELFSTPDEAAKAVYEVALNKMGILVREVTVNQGYDPRDCALVCFGGAGGLFAAELARLLEIPTVFVPPYAGVFSALGATLTRIGYEHSVSWYRLLSQIKLSELDARIRSVVSEGEQELTADRLPIGHIQVALDLKYPGESFELKVPLSWSRNAEVDSSALQQAVGQFHADHARLYGLPRPEEQVELVSIRAFVYAKDEQTLKFPSVLARPDGAGDSHTSERTVKLPVFGGRPVPVVPLSNIKPGDNLGGPAIIEDDYTTVAVPEYASAHLTESGGLKLIALGG